MTKGKYLSDLYKSIENKSFNVDEAIKFIVDKKRKILMKQLRFL